MSKRTLLLILVLTIITGVLLYFAAATNRQETPAPAGQQAISPTPKPLTNTIVALMPNPLQLASATGSLDVRIEPNGNTVTGVDFEISYDPSIITTVVIKPTKYFSDNPVVLTEKINQQEGKARYALAISPSDKPKTEAGVLATITFQAIGRTGTATKIDFTGNTIATDIKYSGSVLKTATGTTITFGTAQTTQPAGPSVTTVQQRPLQVTTSPTQPAGQ